MESVVTMQGVANMLSCATILSCLFLKVPQIQSIRNRRSADGIYIQAMLMEIFGFTVMTLYNFTNGYGVLTYLEYPIILLQLYVLLYYTLLYKKLLHYSTVPLASMAYVGLVLGFAIGMLDKDYLSYIVPLCTPLSGFAKVTYMYGIVKAGNADAVSLTTWIISVATNLTRLFTVCVDSADPNLIFNFAVSSSLSMGVLGTAVYYQSIDPGVPSTHRRRQSSSSSSNKPKRA